METFLPFIGLSILSMIALTLFSGAVAHGVQGHIRGRRFDWGAGILASYRRVLTLIAVGILLAIAQILWCCCCAGVFLSVVWYTAVPVAVVERVGFVGSLRRSNQLTEGFRIPVFGVFLVAFLLFVGANMAAGFVEYVHPMAGLILQWVIQIFANSYTAVSQSVTYYELRSAKEGVDLEDLEDVF